MLLLTDLTSVGGLSEDDDDDVEEDDRPNMLAILVRLPAPLMTVCASVAMLIFTGFLSLL